MKQLLELHFLLGDLRCPMLLPQSLSLVLAKVCILTNRSFIVFSSNLNLYLFHLGNMAVSNVLGANIFDVLFALGLPWFLLTLIDQAPVEVNRGGAVIYTAILFGALFTLIGTLFIGRWRLGRVLAAVLFAFYAAFFIFIILHTVGIIPF